MSAHTRPSRLRDGRLGLLGAVTAVLAAIALGGSLITGVGEQVVHLFFFQTALFGLVLGVVAVAASRRGTVNLGVWVTSVAGLVMALESTGVFAAAWTLRATPQVMQILAAGNLAPNQLPNPAAWLMVPERTWLLSLGGFLTIGLLLFPDGSLPSRRWRTVAVLSALGLATYTVGNVMAGWPTSSITWYEINPATTPGRLMSLGMPLTGIGTLGAVASLVMRHRKADSEQRKQVRWMLFGAGLLAVGFVFTFAAGAALFGLGSEGQLQALNLVTLVAPIFLIVAYGMAILKYRLYEIDVVMNRSIVFGTLAVFITGVYVMIVVGVGSLIGDRSNVVLAVAATAFVAVLFEPARQHVQRWANVLVYGVRATPYEVLASMTVPRQSLEEMISASAATIAGGVGAVAAAVFSVSGSDTEVLSVWPDGGALGAGEWDLEIPMVHAGEEVGRVAVRKQRGDRVSHTDRRLVDEFAGQASLLLANARLNRRLSRRLEELAESRRRLVTAHDEARRKLERDLHDGAQQELVALKVKLGLAVTVARSEGAEELAEELGVASGAADRAVEVLRDLARGIYPPLLEAEGLVAAVESLIYKSGLGVEMDIDGVGRHPRPVEAAVYFCLLEALNALSRRSGDATARIRLAEAEDGLTFSLGSGERGAVAVAGSSPLAEWEGIDLLRDRLDAVGGTLNLDHGRYLEGVIPSVLWT